jgi:hypothetical protein
MMIYKARSQCMGKLLRVAGAHSTDPLGSHYSERDHTCEVGCGASLSTGDVILEKTSSTSMSRAPAEPVADHHDPNKRSRTVREEAC